MGEESACLKKRGGGGTSLNLNHCQACFLYVRAFPPQRPLFRPRVKTLSVVLGKSLSVNEEELESGGKYPI